MADFDQIFPVTEVKKRLLELLKQLQELNGTIAITKNGVPAGVLMSLDEYESLLETIEILANPATVKALQQSREEHAAGKLIDHREVWK
ncbi:MAG: type II toxin-antitoxin system prevent-host-death family antitoxin [Deltaproteobacteria bacterium]|nr:type II toxin-antitoxin system prevent-host-death family antitoxin [Deltaproteobacteria bacterium]